MNQNLSKSHRSGFITTDDANEIAWYDYGHENDPVVLFFHGGPGSGFNHKHAEIFSDVKLRFISFDQRGCGLSKPHGFSETNTTYNIIHDATLLVDKLNIDTLFVAGHSWGSTLASIFSAQSSHHIKGLSLASTFLGRPQDHDWTLDGIRKFLPELFSKLDKSLGFPNSAKERTEKLLHHTKTFQTNESHQILYNLEMLTRAGCRINPPITVEIDTLLANSWSILLEYALKNFYLKQDGIIPYLKDINDKDYPVFILHGKYDFDCCPEQSYIAQELISRSNLRITYGSHSIFEEPLKHEWKKMIIDMVHASP